MRFFRNQFVVFPITFAHHISPITSASFSQRIAVVSCKRGLRDIGRTINNVARKPKCRQVHRCIDGPSIEELRGKDLRDPGLERLRDTCVVELREKTKGC